MYHIFIFDQFFFFMLLILQNILVLYIEEHNIIKFKYFNHEYY